MLALQRKGLTLAIACSFAFAHAPSATAQTIGILPASGANVLALSLADLAPVCFEFDEANYAAVTASRSEEARRRSAARFRKPQAQA